ncbi:MAG: alpha-glucosidase [Solobacterium sp.]|nr:alpha-glucosidase [Solobacterium sp.]
MFDKFFKKKSRDESEEKTLLSEEKAMAGEEKPFVSEEITEAPESRYTEDYAAFVNGLQGTRKWWQDTVAYEVYMRSFNDTTGSGTGDIKGITEKLDYLQSLGVGALWLTPFFKSPMRDNGYDIADYCSVDPSFGTMEDMDELIEEAKKRNIRIVADLVFNHTSDRHPWFLESASSCDNDKADWYIWRDAKEDGSEPTNWRSIFGGSAWTWCEFRGQYYLHTFASAQPDLNWANPAVREALYETANFWVDKGIGGFRIDAITYIRKPKEFKDGEPDGADGMVSVHDMTANTEGILDYLHEFKKNVCDGKDIFTVAEANGVSADELKYWVGREGVFDMLFEFSHVNLEFKGVETWCRPDPWTISDLKRVLRDSQNATRDNGWYPVFFENHDKPRSVSHYFPEGCDAKAAAKAMGMLLMTMRGTPFIYQGEELGLANTAFADITEYDDISSHAQYAFARQEGFSEEEALACVHRFSRDNARTPMQWTPGLNAGFTEGEPWLPVHSDYEVQNAETESADRTSVLTWYRVLSRLRTRMAVLREGSWEEVLPDHPGIIGYRRVLNGESALILINLTADMQAYDPQTEAGASVLLAANAHEKGVMQPFEAVLLVANNA